MTPEFHATIEAIAPAAWDRLVPDSYPFLAHAFLAAMERHGAVGAVHGWRPRYLVLHDDQGIAGAAACWEKDDSWGEFVFDFAWAEAYARHGLHYYPKLVCAVPWTPATGPRLLVAPDRDRETVAAALADAMREQVTAAGLSSAHCLFPHPRDADALARAGWLLRTDVHYFWTNRDWRDFDDFLGAFASRKRKKIRRERRAVREQGIEMALLRGDALSREDWTIVHAFYADTFLRRWNPPVFTRDFFIDVAAALGERLLVSLARRDGRPIAAAILFRDDHTLYGRYWGAEAEYSGLHFEACYYQGIEYCIREGLRRFEPGAQGEHKIARGFLPTFTRSAHWIAHPAFRQAISGYLAQEHRLIEGHHAALSRHTPFHRTS